MIGCSQFRHCLAGHAGHPIRRKAAGYDHALGGFQHPRTA